MVCVIGKIFYFQCKWSPLVRTSWKAGSLLFFFFLFFFSFFLSLKAGILNAAKTAYSFLHKEKKVRVKVYSIWIYHVCEYTKSSQKGDNYIVALRSFVVGYIVILTVLKKTIFYVAKEEKVRIEHCTRHAIISKYENWGWCSCFPVLRFFQVDKKLDF